jgi:hypothetical protein
MRIDRENRLIVIPQSQLRPSAREQKLNTIESYDFPRSRRPIEDAETVLVYNEDSFICIKHRRKMDLTTINTIENMDYLQVMLRRLSDLIAMDKMEPENLDKFDFEDIFGRRSKKK